MKYYLIYINNNFFAWSNDKNTIKDFKKLISAKIDIITIKDRVLPEYLLFSSDFTEKELIYYQGYRYVDAGPIRICDMETMYERIVQMYTDFKASCLVTLSNIKYINIPDDIKKTFNDKINMCLELSDDIIMSDGECVYDEVIDIPKFIKSYIKEIVNTRAYKQ